MRYPWLFVVPLVAVFAIIIATILRFLKSTNMKKRHRGAALVAHTRDVRELPEYVAAQKRYRLLLGLAAVTFVVAASSATVLASRPITISESKNEQSNRDIMLCLDVSGSMDGVLEETLSYFKELTENMKGERIGVVIFDGAYVTMSPLTDDYYAISQVLDEIKDSYGNLKGKLSIDGRNSLVGLGLSGCVKAFENNSINKRSRFIIISTDNEDYGTTVSLKKASQLAKEYGIAIYGLYTGNSEHEKKFSDAIALNGGTYYRLTKNDDENRTSVRKVINAIMKTEAKKYEKIGQIRRTDSPETTTIVFICSAIILLVILWRLHI